MLAAPEESERERNFQMLRMGPLWPLNSHTSPQKYFKAQNISVKIVALSGSTEIAPFIGVSDLITDLTSTGTTLKMNHLQMVETILESSVHLIANPDSYQE